LKSGYGQVLIDYPTINLNLTKRIEISLNGPSPSYFYFISCESHKENWNIIALFSLTDALAIFRISQRELKY